MPKIFYLLGNVLGASFHLVRHVKIILQLLLIILIFSCQKTTGSASVVTIKVPEIANDVWMTMSEIVDTAIYILWKRRTNV